MNIFVTGGCGYKGSVLVPRLLAQGHSVKVFDCQWFGNHLPEHPDLTLVKGDIRHIKAIDLVGSDAVIHLAAVANDPCGELDSKLTWETNVLATMQLAEASVSANISQFIYASSGSVYGIKDEEQVTEDLSLTPITDYNKTKMIAERVLLSYMNHFSLQIIRPATVCGYSPRMRLDVTVNLLTSQALHHKNMTILGGSQVRPNIHIEDMADVYLFFLNHPEFTGIYNAGFENLSVQSIADSISEKITGTQTIRASTDPRSYRVCSDKLLQTGFSPKKSVIDAIFEIQDYFSRDMIRESKICHNIKWMNELKAQENL